MTDRPDLDILVTAWLRSEAPERASGHVLAAALERTSPVHQQRFFTQRVFGERAGRVPGLRLAVAAAIVSVAIVGTIVGGGAVVRNLQAPIPTPSPRPSVPTFSGTRALAAGTYRITMNATWADWRSPSSPRPSPIPDVLISVTVPDGWIGRVGNTVLKPGSRPTRDASLSFGAINNLYADVCHWQGGHLDPPIGPGVDDLAMGLAARSSNPTTPTPFSLDGYAGKYVEVTTRSDMTACDQRVSRIEITGTDAVHLPAEHLRYWILDLDGSRLVISAVDFPETPAADRAQLQAIIGSIRIYP